MKTFKRYIVEGDSKTLYEQLGYRLFFDLVQRAQKLVPGDIIVNIKDDNLNVKEFDTQYRYIQPTWENMPDTSEIVKLWVFKNHDYPINISLGNFNDLGYEKAGDNTISKVFDARRDTSLFLKNLGFNYRLGHETFQPNGWKIHKSDIKKLYDYYSDDFDVQASLF